MTDTERGLALVGWHSDGRVTSEEKLILEDLALEAIQHHKAGTLDAQRVVDLSFRAFDILYAGLLDPAERAAIVTFHYSASHNLRPDIGLIDEAILSSGDAIRISAIALPMSVLL